MKETPLPLMVSAMTTLGLSAIRLRRAKVCSMAWVSWPSIRSTCQPKAANLADRSPSDEVRSTE